MPSADLQAAIARLSTDTDFRQRFLRDPARAAAALGLREDDRAALLAVDRGRLQRLAGSLLAKRAQEVAEMMPTVARALGTEWRERFLAHAARFRPGGTYLLEADAVRFLETLTGDRTIAPEVRDAARRALRGFELRFRRAPGWSEAEGGVLRRRGGRLALWWDGGPVAGVALPGREPVIRRLP